MHRIAIGCLCLILTSQLLAEQLEVPIGQQGDQSQSRPATGMSTTVVEEKFGAPENITDPIGEPPITVWKYNRFTVYFEYDLVIHTVLNKS
ncbi:MAG: hypothetical protein GY829_11785 [Gammaproteobacteria bacterium]|nr:hypothetical protein [Gammaproteobacteria bacterium]